jgi:hypothetical protein
MDAKLWAFDPVRKATKWTAPLAPSRVTENCFESPPALDEATGRLYCGGVDGLYAYGLDGKLKWKYPVAAKSWYMPAIARDGGTIYAYVDMASREGQLHAIRSDGTARWIVGQMGHANEASQPVIGGDDTVYVSVLGLHAFQDFSIKRPTILYFKVSPTPVFAHQPLQLKAMTVNPGVAPISRVEFYLDVNQNGMLDLDPAVGPVDLLLGSDQDGTDGWSLSIAEGFADGDYGFLAVAIDGSGMSSNVVRNSISILPSQP